MGDQIKDFFEWNYHIREFYDGVVLHALSEKPISLDFTKKSEHCNDSTIFGLIMAHENQGNDNNSCVSYWTSIFPNKNSEDFHPNKPNPKWGKLCSCGRRDIPGKVKCCTVDQADNILTGSDSKIEITTPSSYIEKDIDAPAYLARYIPGEPANAVFCLSNKTAIKYDSFSSSTIEIFETEKEILDMSIHPMDCCQILAAQKERQALHVDIREGLTTTIRLDNELTSIAFAPQHQFLFMAGFADGSISFVDQRQPSMALSASTPHDKAITGIKWSPFDADVAACGSNDAAITIWSLRDSTQDEMTYVFAHNGHASPIVAFDWCKDTPWTMASVSEDKLLEVWTIAPSVLEENV